MTTWTKIIAYSTGAYRVEFYPYRAVPGYSHRVRIIAGRTLIASDWLSASQTPTAKAAQFYADKHAAAIAAHFGTADHPEDAPFRGQASRNCVEG